MKVWLTNGFIWLNSTWIEHADNQHTVILQHLSVSIRPTRASDFYSWTCVCSLHPTRHSLSVLTEGLFRRRRKKIHISLLLKAATAVWSPCSCLPFQRAKRLHWYESWSSEDDRNAFSSFNTFFFSNNTRRLPLPKDSFWYESLVVGGCTLFCNASQSWHEWFWIDLRWLKNIKYFMTVMWFLRNTKGESLKMSNNRTANGADKPKKE